MDIAIISYIIFVLYLPSFLILSLIKGANSAMHYTEFNTFLLVSYFFYTFLIAAIQIYFFRKKRSKVRST